MHLGAKFQLPNYCVPWQKISKFAYLKNISFFICNLFRLPKNKQPNARYQLFSYTVTAHKLSITVIIGIIYLNYSCMLTD